MRQGKIHNARKAQQTRAKEGNEDTCLCRCAQDGIAARQLLWTFSPDAAVVDLMLPGTDGLSLLQEAADHGFHPSVLAVTGYLSDYVLEALGRLQVDYVMRKPCSVEAAATRAADLLRQLPCPVRRQEDPRATVTELLRSLKVPVHVQGYAYLREAIPLFAEDPRQAITKELYPAVGKRYNASSDQVERAIRNAIELAWQRRDERIWRMYFAPAPDGSIPRPTNGQLLHTLMRQISGLQKDEKIG